MNYDEQVVIAFIDGAKVLYQGKEISDQNDNIHDFLKDKTEPEEAKQRFKAQYGERCNAENLHEKNQAKSRLVIVDDYVPHTSSQETRLKTELAKIPKLGPNSRVYIVAHSDADSCRMAGLKPNEMANLLLHQDTLKDVKRFNLLGCHTAGEAGTAQDASLTVSSFASQFHLYLGRVYDMFTEVMAYTSYTTISEDGKKQVRFDPQEKHGSKLPRSKVRFYWTAPGFAEERYQVRGFVHA